MDYLKCLKYLKDKNISFNLVFLDPPYKEHIIESILTTLVNNNLLKENALIIAEFMGDTLKKEYNNLILIKERTYGEKQVYIYKYKGERNEEE